MKCDICDDTADIFSEDNKIIILNSLFNDINVINVKGLCYCCFATIHLNNMSMYDNNFSEHIMKYLRQQYEYFYGLGVMKYNKKQETKQNLQNLKMIEPLIS